MQARRIGTEADGMGHEGQAAALVQRDQIVPKCCLIAKRKSDSEAACLPSTAMATALPFSRCLRGGGGMPHRGLETAVRSICAVESVAQKLHQELRQRDIR